ncbi:hypothetical protein TRICHSKD4_0096 [Roseibium sp. TrichSKD4]|nr:hypothetical protein TRICHSKD4_0096 [Roseibium sp. TrichSKD4]
MSEQVVVDARKWRFASRLARPQHLEKGGIYKVAHTLGDAGLS